jgi:hypothetical protein
MSKKKNNRIILIIFVVLLAAVGANELIKASRGERSFRKDIVEMDANDIRKLVIIPKNAGNRNVEVFQQDTLWKLKVEDKLFAADQEMIKGIIDELAAMTPERLVANKREAWAEYDITDSLGVRLSVFGKGKDEVRLTLGRFSYNQATRKPSTFVRVNNEKEIYAVEGYLGMTFNREINNLRDKNLFRGNQNDLTQIRFTYPADSSFTLTKQDNKWLADGLPVDSASMAGYLNAVSYLIGSEFRDDFIVASAPVETWKVEISGLNMKPVEIKGYTDSRGTILLSSENSSTCFSGDPGQLFYKVFQRKSAFFGSQKTK